MKRSTLTRKTPMKRSALSAVSASMTTIKTEPSFSVRICIAGNYADAERICREFCFNGYCVTLEVAEYIYAGGQESGVVVGLINYPRFPSNHDLITDAAKQLGMKLMEGLFQQSFCVVTPVDTIWFSRRPQE